MPLPQRSPLDKKVSPKWKPVAELEKRKPGMMWSDRVWHWLVTLAGVVIAACGVAVIAFVHVQGAAKIGGGLFGVGVVLFFLGTPSQARRNGYRD